MSPIVRGRAIAQIESSGRTKKSFDVLVWIENLSRKAFRAFDEVQQLREYLGTIEPKCVAVNFWLPNAFAKTHTVLNEYAITALPLMVAVPSDAVKQALGPR